MILLFQFDHMFFLKTLQGVCLHLIVFPYMFYLLIFMMSTSTQTMGSTFCDLFCFSNLLTKSDFVSFNNDNKEKFFHNILSMPK